MMFQKSKNFVSHHACLKKKLFYFIILFNIMLVSSCDSPNDYVSHEELTYHWVEESVPVKCQACTGTGYYFDFIAGMNMPCLYCYNGVIYSTRTVMKAVPISFTGGGGRGCNYCRETYCPAYIGKVGFGNYCNRKSCSHRYEDHRK